jgi:hypothetical protein
MRNFQPEVTLEFEADRWFDQLGNTLGRQSSGTIWFSMKGSIPGGILAGVWSMFLVGLPNLRCRIAPAIYFGVFFGLSGRVPWLALRHFGHHTTCNVDTLRSENTETFDQPLYSTDSSSG